MSNARTLPSAHFYIGNVMVTNMAGKEQTKTHTKPRDAPRRKYPTSVRAARLPMQCKPSPMSLCSLFEHTPCQLWLHSLSFDFQAKEKSEQGRWGGKEGRDASNYCTKLSHKACQIVHHPGGAIARLGAHRRNSGPPCGSAVNGGGELFPAPQKFSIQFTSIANEKRKWWTAQKTTRLRRRRRRCIVETSALSTTMGTSARATRPAPHTLYAVQAGVGAWASHAARRIAFVVLMCCNKTKRKNIPTTCVSAEQLSHSPRSRQTLDRLSPSPTLTDTQNRL